MKTTIQKLERIFESSHNYTDMDSYTKFLALRRAIFLLAHEIDEIKDIK